jgi:ABC-2 type transport system permease protein
MVIAKRDFVIEVSYHFALLSRIGTLAATVGTYYFIARIIDPAQLQQYSGEYFEFVLVGLLLGILSSVGIGAFTETLRVEQSSGTLEVLLATPTSLPTLVIGSLIVPMAFALVEIVLVFGFAIIFAGANFQASGLVTAALAIPPTVAMFAGIGGFSAGFIVLSKRGDPFTPLVTQTTNFLAGALFPIAVLPAMLQSIAYLLPPYYSLEVLRAGLINGESINEVAGYYAILVAFALVLLPLSLRFLRKALRTARITGTLASD